MLIFDCVVHYCIINESVEKSNRCELGIAEDFQKVWGVNKRMPKVGKGACEHVTGKYCSETSCPIIPHGLMFYTGLAFINLLYYHLTLYSTPVVSPQNVIRRSYFHVVNTFPLF